MRDYVRGKGWVGAKDGKPVDPTTGQPKEDAAPTEETKPVEREAFEGWARTHNLARSPSGVEYEWAEAAWQASAAAALERAAALMRTRAEDLGKQGYDEFHKAADDIRALKGSR